MDEATLQITPTDFSFSALVQENADAFAEPFALRRITMRSDIRPDLWLHADQGHITQLLSILLENALKYTNDGGFVTVTLKKEGRGTLLQIANTCDTLPDVPPAVFSIAFTGQMRHAHRKKAATVSAFRSHSRSRRQTADRSQQNIRMETKSVSRSSFAPDNVHSAQKFQTCAARRTSQRLHRNHSVKSFF